MKKLILQNGASSLTMPNFKALTNVIFIKKYFLSYYTHEKIAPNIELSHLNKFDSHIFLI